MVLSVRISSVLGDTMSESQPLWEDLNALMLLWWLMRGLRTWSDDVGKVLFLNWILRRPMTG